MRVALVQEHRLADASGQLELAMEGLLLRRGRREIAEIVQPAFAHRHDFIVTGELLEFNSGRGAELVRVVRVNSGGGEQSPRMGACERDRSLAACKCRAGDQHLYDTR